uniref:Uncharacterized protein n=1 Tax=Anser cygnoides TaxID=8845 RepID=A0A8B9EY17_ANSCY
MERANTITYLKGETIGTETRKKGDKECAATGLFPKNINRLHVTQLSIVCPFKYLVYMKRQREERPKKIYYTGHEVKSCKEYNIPLRNNKSPRCCCCDSRVTGVAAALLSQQGPVKHKRVPTATRKMWWSLDQNNIKKKKTLGGLLPSHHSQQSASAKFSFPTDGPRPSIPMPVQKEPAI